MPATWMAMVGQPSTAAENNACWAKPAKPTPQPPTKDQSTQRARQNPKQATAPNPHRTGRSPNPNPAISCLSASRTPASTARYPNASRGVRETCIDPDLHRNFHEGQEGGTKLAFAATARTSAAGVSRSRHALLSITRDVLNHVVNKLPRQFRKVELSEHRAQQ